MRKNSNELERIVYSSPEIKDRFGERYELKLLKEYSFINHSYLIILGIWFHIPYKVFRMVYIITKNDKVEAQYNVPVPLTVFDMKENFYDSNLFKQILRFKLLDNTVISFQYDFNHDYRRLKQLELAEDVPLNIEKAPILEEGIRGGIWGDASKLSTKELLSKMFGSKWVEKYVFEQEGRLIVNTDLDFKKRGLSQKTIPVSSSL